MNERARNYGIVVSTAVLVGASVSAVWLVVLYLILGSLSVAVVAVSAGCGIVAALYHVVHWRRLLKRGRAR